MIGITNCREAASGENWTWMVTGFAGSLFGANVAEPENAGSDASLSFGGCSQPPTEAEGLRPSLNFVLNH